MSPEYAPFGGDTWRDPYPLYTWLRDEDPVHLSTRLGVWILSRFGDVFDAALDSKRFSSAQGLSFRNETEQLSLLPTMVMMDPPEHTRLRRMVSSGFSPRSVKEIEPAIRSFVADRVEQLCSSGSADLIDEIARPLPCFVVAHYLGVPEQDRSMFEGWTQAIVQANVTGNFAADSALADLYSYFDELLSSHRNRPGDDPLSAILQSAPQGKEMTTEEALGYAFVMIAGGNDTATGLIGGAAELLTEHRGERQVLVDDRSLVTGAVEELLRMTTPVQGLCRVTTCEVEVSGVTIPADSRVMLCFGAANRDPREFGPDADRLDVTRRVRRQLAFSSGVHHCLGSHAARLQGRIVIEELLRQCPAFEVDALSGRFASGAFVRRYESLPFFANV